MNCPGWGQAFVRQAALRHGLAAQRGESGEWRLAWAWPTNQVTPNRVLQLNHRRYEVLLLCSITAHQQRSTH